MRLGYCCINETLRNTKPAKNSVFCGRSLIKRTFTLAEAGKRALANCRDLLTILKWNEEHDIRCFRISSNLFPRYTCGDFGYSLDDLAEADQIRVALKEAGDYAISHGHLLSMHPGQYNVLCSKTDKVIENTIKDLEYHSLVADLIDPGNKLQIDINIHMGGTYNATYIETAQRFNTNFKLLSKSLQNRLRVENDDKPCPGGGWNVQKLYEYVYNEIDIPITWDIHHSHFSRGPDMSLEEEYRLARSTWGNKIMMIHYSESSREDKEVPAHSCYYKNRPPLFLDSEENYRIELECKGKELALLKMRRDFLV